MEYRNLGKSGLKVSEIGLGTNQFGGKVDQAGTNSILDAAIDFGINFIDTADIYQKGRSEEFIGEALRSRRDKLLIATKVYHKMGEGPNDFGASRQHIISGVEDSLCIRLFGRQKVPVTKQDAPRHGGALAHGLSSRGPSMIITAGMVSTAAIRQVTSLIAMARPNEFIAWFALT